MYGPEISNRAFMGTEADLPPEEECPSSGATQFCSSTALIRPSSRQRQ